LEKEQSFRSPPFHSIPWKASPDRSVFRLRRQSVRVPRAASSTLCPPGFSARFVRDKSPSPAFAGPPVVILFPDLWAPVAAPSMRDSVLTSALGPSSPAPLRCGGPSPPRDRNPFQVSSGPLLPVFCTHWSLYFGLVLRPRAHVFFSPHLPAPPPQPSPRFLCQLPPSSSCACSEVPSPFRPSSRKFSLPPALFDSAPFGGRGPLLFPAPPLMADTARFPPRQVAGSPVLIPFSACPQRECLF